MRTIVSGNRKLEACGENSSCQGASVHLLVLYAVPPSVYFSSLVKVRIKRVCHFVVFDDRLIAVQSQVCYSDTDIVSCEIDFPIH